MATCGECEFFGDYVVMLYSSEWKKHTRPGGAVSHYHPFIGFDEKQGAGCTYDKDAWHKRIRFTTTPRPAASSSPRRGAGRIAATTAPAYMGT